MLIHCCGTSAVRMISGSFNVKSLQLSSLNSSPVSVVWSVGGSVPLLALCLCHLLCPSLVSVHWHWPLSNVHGPESIRRDMSNTAGKDGRWMMMHESHVSEKRFLCSRENKHMNVWKHDLPVNTEPGRLPYDNLRHFDTLNYKGH